MNHDDTDASARVRALADAAPDGLVMIDEKSRIQFANPAIEDVLGYAPEEILGEPLSVLVSGDLEGRRGDVVDRYLTADADRPDRDRIELPGRHSDGREVPLEVSFGEATIDGTRYVTGVLRERTDSETLERLNELGQELTGVETYDEACERAVAAARDVLDLPITTIERYDPETGSFEPSARTARVRELVGDGRLFESDRGLPWRAFTQSETRVVSDVSEAPDIDGETPLSSAIVVPIGEHGVFVSGATEPGAIPDSTVTLAELLVGNVTAVFDRLEREARLSERNAELVEKTERLQRVQRVNDEIRAITETMMDATSRTEIKQVVCDRLADSDPYRFVWFGERNLATDEVVSSASAGVEDGYLDIVDITADTSETGQGPAGRAVRTREAQIQNNLHSDPPFEPWRQEAMERGYRASIAVPVVYDGTLYGLLNLYANEPDVFTEMEAAVLTELGEMIGYALNAMERYDAFVSQESVELEFVVRDPSNPLSQFLGDHDATARLEDIGTRDTGSLQVFAAFAGVSFERIRSFFEGELEADDVTLVRDRGDETVVELALPEESFLVSLLQRGAMPSDVTVSPERAKITVRVPQSASVREFVDLFDDRFDDAELVARRTSPESVQTREEFERAYVDRLTERQREVLQTAYFAGFFEQPRDNTAEDLAEMLDVTQPTVSRHLRNSQQTLFSMLFSDG